MKYPVYRYLKNAVREGAEIILQSLYGRKLPLKIVCVQGVSEVWSEKQRNLRAIHIRLAYTTKAMHNGTLCQIACRDLNYHKGRLGSIAMQFGCGRKILVSKLAKNVGN